MKNYKGVVKLKSTKYLNMYASVYGDENKLEYYFVSRRDEKDIQRIDYVDAVKVLPYIKQTDEIVFIKNFRYAVNDYVYEIPAGLVDKGEDCVEAAKREIREEIGGEVKMLSRVNNCGYTSVGLTDETLIVYVAQVELNYEQDLDQDEDITVIKVKCDDAINFVMTHNVDVVTSLMVQLFVAKR